MRGFRANYADFQAANTEIIEISCDPLAIQKAWVMHIAEEVDDGVEGVPFHVASDFWPHGEVTRAYDVFNDERGNARRAAFIVDPEGMIRWSNVYVGEIPASEDILYEIGKL